jgi:hypothetical protein
MQTGKLSTKKVLFATGKNFFQQKSKVAVPNVGLIKHL